MLRQIPVTLPWSFADALGYPRGFRWVAFFWEPCGDEAMFDDGCCCADGNWYGFQQFVRHPSVAPWLKDYDLGSSEDEAKDYLLCDLESREIYIGPRAEVKEHLAKEVIKYLPAGAPRGTVIDFSNGDMAELLTKIREALQQIPAPSMA